MTGRRRLGVVLSAVYWAVALAFSALVYFAMRTGPDSVEVLQPGAWTMITLAISAALYIAAAGIWWALDGFREP